MVKLALSAVFNAFQEAWLLRWPFLLSRLVFGLVFLALLAPLITFTLRSAIVLSGQPALSDFDIALYLLSPVGFAAALFFGSLALTTYVLNISFMMAIALHARRTGERRLEAGVALVIPRFRNLLGFAWRLLVRVLGLVLPLLVFGLFIAQRNLTEFDINYYLDQRPPEFLRAALLIGAALLITLVFLLRALTSWAVALPFVLFQNTPPSDSFMASRVAMAGHKRGLLVAILFWAGASAAVLSTVFALASLAADLAAGSAGANLERLAGILLILLAIWSIANLLVTATTIGALANLLMERAGWPGITGLEGADIEDRYRLRVGLFVSLAFAGLFALFGASDLSRFQTENDSGVEVIAHRGAAGARPENTIAAFAKAIEDQADWIELDVQESAEGEVIVVHDSDFMKLAGNPLKAWDATAVELAEIDVGSWFHPDYASERTPLLRDVLELAKGTGTGVLIELKYYGHDKMLEQRVAEVVEATGMTDEVQVMSLKYEAVKKMKDLRPDWTVGLLAAASVGRLWELEADFLAVNSSMASINLVARSEEVGQLLHVWTVNDPLSMSRMLSLGVNGLITDEPALAREIIEERAALSTIERLVIALGSQLGLASPSKAYRDGSP